MHEPALPMISGFPLLFGMSSYAPDRMSWNVSWNVFEKTLLGPVLR